MHAIAPFLLRVVAFALVAAALYPLLLAGFGFAMPDGYAPNIRYPVNSTGHLRTRMQELERHGPVDIVFLGSSHAYRGFDPRVWSKRGFSSFNLGSSAQTLLQTEVLVNAHFTDLKPQMVILEVHPGPFTDAGVESAVDFITNRGIDARTLRMALRMPDVLTWNALAYGLVRQFSGYDSRFIESRTRGKDVYVDGGYVMRTHGHFAPAKRLKPQSAMPLTEQWAAFERILDDLRSLGIEVVLVEAPMTRWYYEGGYIGLADLEQRLATSGRYINMNGKVALDDSLHFFTKGHLNQAGAELFNEALIDTLAARGWLPAAPQR